MPAHKPWPLLRLSRRVPGLGFLGVTALGFLLGVISQDRGWHIPGLIGYWITAIGVLGGTVAGILSWLRGPGTGP